MLEYFFLGPIFYRSQTDSVNFKVQHRCRYRRPTMRWSISHHGIKTIRQRWDQQILTDKIIHRQSTVAHIHVIERLQRPKVNLISPFLFILNYVRISIMDFVKLQIIIQQVAMNLNSSASKICCHPKIFPFGNRLQWAHKHPSGGANKPSKMNHSTKIKNFSTWPLGNTHEHSLTLDVVTVGFFLGKLLT